MTETIGFDRKEGGRGSQNTNKQIAVFICSQFLHFRFIFQEEALASAQRHQSHKMCSILVLVGAGDKQGEDRFDKVKL